MNQKEIEKKLEALKKTLYAFEQTHDFYSTSEYVVIPDLTGEQVTFEQVIEKLSELEDEITKASEGDQ